MKLSSFYNFAIKFGIGCDPRRKKKDLRFFPDSALLYGDPDTDVKRILVGIDIEVPELLLAERIRTQDSLDLAVSHHPEGRAYASLADVILLQADMLIRAGVTENVAREMVEIRKNEVERAILSKNHMRSVDAARILNIPFICLHTPADNHAQYFINMLMAKRSPKRVGDILDILLELPEYRMAEEGASGPRLILGNSLRRTGKIFTEMTGGTEGPRDIYSRLSKKGIRTLICMHLSEEHFRKVRDANLNVVIAGHISSDTLGLNLLLDKIEQKSEGGFEIINCSGFRRFRRK